MSTSRIEVNEDAVKAHMQQAIQVLQNEVERFGSFREQYDALEDFREALVKYIRWVSPGRELFRAKSTLIESGDVLDWHVTGYFAPLDFKKISWGGVKRSPSEHVVALNNALKKQGTRLIYVALPCKGVIYPELAVERSLFRVGAPTGPQWRKMVLEMLESGVEEIDMFPVFWQHRNHLLYSYEHNISPEGAALTAQIISDYIKNTSNLDRVPKTAFSMHQNDMWYHPWQSNAPENHVRQHRESCIKKDGMEYLPFGNCSSICIFGNCNLQAFLYRGSGIAANLAYQLQTDVDYIGRKLIFGSGSEAFDIGAFEKSAIRDIAICISFPSDSFVRASQLDKRKIKGFFQYGTLVGQWSTMELEQYSLEERII